MSPWTFIGWCLAVCVGMATIFAVGTAIGSTFGFLWMVFSGKKKTLGDSMDADEKRRNK